MGGERHGFVIVGSGAGGATLARELARRGADVLVVERGRPAARLGSFAGAARLYDVAPVTNVPAKSREGVILWRAFAAGGSTVVACGNMTRCLEEELSQLGIDLEAELAEAEAEMGVAPIAPALLSPGAHALRAAAAEIGCVFTPMPKAIDPLLCRGCAACTLGCAREAKWTARRYLREAEEAGAQVLYGHEVSRVRVRGGVARGVVATGGDGQRELAAEVVVVAAGGLGTPVILRRSGLAQAGEGLFVDLLVNTYGVTGGLNQLHEPLMSLVGLQYHAEEGFLLSPYVNVLRRVRLIEAGVGGFRLPAERLVGIMTKIADEPTGSVAADGRVSKAVTASDRRKLERGSSLAREILVRAGADPRSLRVSRPQGAHPGGTAALGRVVDTDLQTAVDNLFVCDASVLPVSPGLPPILTIVALAKRLAKTLAG